MKDLALRAQMCEVGRRLWQRGLIGATEGNISARISPQRILCTPAGLSKGHLKPADLVVLDNHGSVCEGGSPSTEILMHLRMYQRRPDCEAIIHAHPPVATGFALAGEDIPDDVLPESICVLGSVASVPFGLPGTDEVPNAMEPLLEDHKTFLLSHHGAAVMGKDLWDAYNRMETLERVAAIILAARQLGAVRPLPSRAFARLQGRLNGGL